MKNHPRHFNFPAVIPESEKDPLRPLYLAVFLFWGLGYVLYFWALFWPPTPQWGRDFMLSMMSTMGALESAARVAAVFHHDPFPAQVVIMYCGVGAIILTCWFAVWFAYCRDARATFLIPDKEESSAYALVKSVLLYMTMTFFGVMISYGLFGHLFPVLIRKMFNFILPDSAQFLTCCLPPSCHHSLLLFLR